MIRSVISPDSTYLLAGSESGKPVLWNIPLGKIEEGVNK